MLRDEYNIESALDFIETQIRILGYLCRHEVNYERYYYTIKHEMVYIFKTTVQIYFEEFRLGRVIFDVRDNTLSFTVNTLSLV